MADGHQTRQDKRVRAKIEPRQADQTEEKEKRASTPEVKASLLRATIEEEEEERESIQLVACVCVCWRREKRDHCRRMGDKNDAAAVVVRKSLVTFG